MRRLLLGSAIISMFLPCAANAQTLIDVIVDGGNNYNWELVSLPNTVCGNGSPYKFFLRRTASTNLLVYFEGGGACWDYDTCSGRAGVLGAANPNGIADDHMQQIGTRYVSPIVNGADPGIPGRAKTNLPTKDWDIVYMPYCTGDVHIGNSTQTYIDATGQEPPLAWSHNGYNNTLAAMDYAASQFPGVNKMLVSGFSAGGVAASAAYYFARNAINPTRGYMLNDSGPIFLAPNVSSRSKALHQQINTSWGLASVFSQLPSTFDPNDFGTMNGAVAQAFPNDQFAYTGYTRDYNFSRFSYERFHTPNDEASVHAYWKQDQDAFVANLSNYNNFSYFIAHHRPINDSHCSTIVTFIGSHACQRMEKKRYFWEYLEFPWGQTYKCYSEFVGMDVFLTRFINNNQRVRIYEPTNWYNNEDPGMLIVAPLINAAIEGA
jgi:hypothetical protein